MSAGFARTTLSASVLLLGLAGDVPARGADAAAPATAATAACGDGLLAKGEPCESCPADCHTSGISPGTSTSGATPKGR